MVTQLSKSKHSSFSCQDSPKDAAIKSTGAKYVWVANSLLLLPHISTRRDVYKLEDRRLSCWLRFYSQISKLITYHLSIMIPPTWLSREPLKSLTGFQKQQFEPCKAGNRCELLLKHHLPDLSSHSLYLPLSMSPEGTGHLDSNCTTRFHLFFTWKVLQF